ncbi:MAG: DUF4364 family protein [Lachnospiraceae bacterium]|nr:DUF4364 family protein [Lachnospiraceae bacterium]
MQPEALMLYKLIILYILDKVDFPLTNVQLTNFILEKGYTNYFNIQQVLSELLEDSFISCNTIRNSSYYEITSSGGETLSFFYDKISDAIKEDIDIFLRDNKYGMREENSTQADFYEARKNEYIATLKVLERGTPIIEIHLSVPSEAEASLICDNWSKKSSEIYARIFATLTEETE